jgi:hypothetical protein
MQRNLLSSLLFTTVIAGVVVSCGRSDKNALPVPKDAGFVMHVNAASLSSKLSWQEIKATSWFQEAYKEADDSVAKQLLEDPEKSGIDSKSDIVLFFKKQHKGGYVAIAGSIKDAATFDAFNKKVNKGADFTKSGDISLMKIEKRAALAHNGKRFVYLIDAPITDISRAFSRGFGGNSAYEAPYSFPLDSLQSFGKQLLTLDGSENMNTDDRFADLIKEPGDVHMWFNTGSYINNMFGSVLGMLKLNAFLEDNVSATTFNFDNGKMTMKSKQYYSKEMTAIINKYPAGTISEDLVNRIPSQDVVAAFVMKYPPQGLKEFLKLIGVDGMINGYLGQLDYSLDEFVKANKGDIIVSVSDVTMTTTPETVIPNPGGEPFKMPGRTEPSAKVLFATSINDKPAFDKLVGCVQKTIGDAGAEAMAEKVSYKLDNNWFAASNNSEFVNAFLTGAKTKQPWAGRISGHAFGGYIDIQKAMKAFQSEARDSSSKAIFDASFAFWQDVVMVSGGDKGDVITSEYTVNLIDKNTNSLKQLNQYVDKIAKATSAKRKHNEWNPDEIMVDSAVAAPAPAPDETK